MKKSFLILISFFLVFAAWGSTSSARKKKKRRNIGWCKFVLSPPVTGQTVSYYPNDDGDKEIGRPLANDRFDDLGNGTVRDNDSALIWTKDAQAVPGTYDWYDAIDQCEALQIDGYNDWRLPNIRELLTLIDFSQDGPAIPEDHPFINVMPGNRYWWVWSSTNQAYRPGNYALLISLGHGDIGGAGRSVEVYVWCVR